MELHHLLLLFAVAIIGARHSTSVFEVELIHRDSPRSPLYNPSSTPEERARGTFLRSLARLNRMNDIRESNVESIITMAGGDFVMEFLIGTPPITTSAIMDTGSDLMWIQCPPCTNCFSQNTPLFDPTKSSTYHSVECGSPICQVNCTGIPSGECPYTYNYEDGSSTSGVLATESFAFLTVKRDQALTAADVVFGCGKDNRGTFSGGGAGIIGLGMGSLSLISQLGSTVEKRFSYCLSKSAEIPSTFKFGVNASFTGKKVVSTPLMVDEANLTYYYVLLEGITVGNTRISTKVVTPGKGNTIVDSGTTLNLLEPYLFRNIVETMKILINLPAIQDPTFAYDLCYQTFSLRKVSMPRIAFHFRGADIEMKNLNIFISSGDLTCLSMASSHKDVNIYGNVAQRNFEVEYNLESKVVSFARAECSWKGAGATIQSHYFITSSLCFLLVLFLVF